MEERRLGDNAVTEGWAMLLQHLIDEPAWLAAGSTCRARTSSPARARSGSSTSSAATAAKLLYELEFFVADDLDAMRARYVELLADALKIEPSPTDYLGDIDGGSTSRSTCARGRSRRSCATSSAREFGNEWFAAARRGLAAAGAVVARPEA